MAETPQHPMMYAEYELRLIRASREVVKRSRKLLDQTRPLLRPIEGGSVMGAHVFNPGEGEPSERRQRAPMDDLAFTACSEMSRRASQLLAKHQDHMRRSREQIALSRRLLAMPVYPYNPVPPHDLFDVSGLKASE